MTALTKPFRRRFLSRRRAELQATEPERADAAATALDQAPVEIAHSDPLLADLQSASAPVDLEELELDSSSTPSCRPEFRHAARKPLEILVAPDPGRCRCLSSRGSRRGR